VILPERGEVLSVLAFHVTVISVLFVPLVGEIENQELSFVAVNDVLPLRLTVNLSEFDKSVS
jgi:hypothetical protein